MLHTSLRRAATLLALVPSVMLAQTRSTMPAVGIDHVILGVDDLEKGMAEFATKTGVKPIKGGVHPGRGTQNALVSLGGGRYIEIMAPSHEPGTSSDARTAFATLTPAGWALHTDNVTSVIASLRGAAFKVSDVSPGARTRPDGLKLNWQTADVSGAGLEDAPFFIQWGALTPHPSNDAPGGCTLESVRMTQTDPAPLARFFRAIKLDVTVPRGPRARWRWPSPAPPERSRSAASARFAERRWRASGRHDRLKGFPACDPYQ